MDTGMPLTPRAGVSLAQVRFFGFVGFGFLSLFVSFIFRFENIKIQEMLGFKTV
jgi:hypothetical protein